MGVLVFVGFLAIVYAGLIIVFLQQDAKQADLQDQIDRTTLIIDKPMSDSSELEAGYDKIQELLVPLTRDEAIALLVEIAEGHGIDADQEAGKLVIPPASITIRPSNTGGYQVMSFGEIRVLGSHANIMALINDLDAGATKETIVLTSVDIRSPDGAVGDGAGDEYGRVRAAVEKMMEENLLSEIPNPADFAGGIAFSNMTAFPDPDSEWQGLPGGKYFDAQGGAYSNGDMPGYVLYNHDNQGNGSAASLITYIDTSQTEWFYTCEADGTVRQFLNADLSGEVAVDQFEVSATLSVGIYFLRAEGE